MAVITFPSSPTTNQTYTVGSKTWIWNGYAWDLQLTNGLANTGSTITVNGSSKFIVANTTASTSNTTGALVVKGGVGVSGNVYTSGGVYAADVSYFGNNTSGYTLTNPIIVARSSSNTAQAGQYYVQVVLENISPAASGDYISYVDTYPGKDNDHGWIDMGITGSAFADPSYGITKSQDGYIFSGAVANSGAGGNLVFATDSTGTVGDLVFATGGFTSTNEVMRFSNVAKSMMIETGTRSTSIYTGALVVSGGAGISGNLYSGGIYITGSSNGITFSDGTTQSTSFSSYLSQLTSAGGYANSAFAQANVATAYAQSAGSYANSAFSVANNVTSAGNYANAAFLAANTAFSAASLAYNQANVSFNTASAAFNKANTANITYTASSTAPVSPKLGDLWYDTTDNIKYEYSTDGTSFFWWDTESAAFTSNTIAEDNIARTTAGLAYNQANTATTTAGLAFNQANAAFNKANTITTSLATLTDVSLSLPTANNYLKYNGSSWVNSNIPSYLVITKRDTTTTSISIAQGYVPVLTRGGTTTSVPTY